MFELQGLGPYANLIKKTEKDIKEMAKKVNDLCGMLSFPLLFFSVGINVLSQSWPQWLKCEYATFAARDSLLVTCLIVKRIVLLTFSLTFCFCTAFLIDGCLMSEQESRSQILGWQFLVSGILFLISR